MKRIFIIIVAFLASTALSFGQDVQEHDVFLPISKYIQQGNADYLSAWFADNLELDVLGEANNCSKNQAKQILKKFFSANTPKSFDIVHKSGSYNMKYAIGHLDGGGYKFRVIIFVNTSEEGNSIQQIKIERE